MVQTWCNPTLLKVKSTLAILGDPYLNVRVRILPYLFCHLLYDISKLFFNRQGYRKWKVRVPQIFADRLTLSQLTKGRGRLCPPHYYMPPTDFQTFRHPCNILFRNRRWLIGKRNRWLKNNTSFYMTLIHDMSRDLGIIQVKF